jgi:hypothetical protein
MLLAISLGGCGGQTTAPTTTIEPQPGPPESPVLFGAERGNSLFVVGARADTGKVIAFGPALPQPAETYEVQSLEISANRQRALAVLSPKVGTPNWTSEDAIVLLGDGSTWKALDRGIDVSVQKASDDLSLVVTSHECAPPDADMAVSVIRADGTHVYDSGACTLGTSTPFVYAVAPNGSYFVVQSNDGALTLHDVDGRDVPLAARGQEAIVGSCFATSLIIAEPEGSHWVDTSGHPIDVPGWSSAVSTPSGLQVLNGGLYALEDRNMRRVADLPPGVDPSTILRVQDGLVFVKEAQDHYAAVDASGAEVASYTPASDPAPRAAAGSPMTVVDPVVSSTTTRNVWSLFGDYYETISGDSPDIYAGAEDLWVVVDGDGRIAPKTLPLRKQPGTPGFTIQPVRDYASSSSGAYVLYTESGTLHVLRIDSGADRKLATDFVMDSVEAITRHAAQ